MRSSKRAPTAIIRSQSCIAQLASQVPCMPSMPSHCRSAAGKAPSPISVEVMGKPVTLDQFAQEIGRGAAGIDHAAAGIEQRPLGRGHHVDGFFDLVEVALDLRPIAAVPELPGLEVGALGELDVLGDVDHDRPRPSAGGDVEGLVQRPRQVGDVLDQIIVFGAGPGDADGVAFLERVVADQMRRHLAGDHDQRDRVAERVGQAGDRIGGAGPGRHQHGADLAGRARITLGGVHGALLVPHQDVVHFVLLEQGIVDRQHRAAGIAKNVLDALIGKRRDHHFRAGHFRHGLLRFLRYPLLPLPRLRGRKVGEVLENKKGAQEPLCRAPPRLAGGIIHPRRCAFLRVPAISRNDAQLCPFC